MIDERLARRDRRAAPRAGYRPIDGAVDPAIRNGAPRSSASRRERRAPPSTARAPTRRAAAVRRHPRQGRLTSTASRCEHSDHRRRDRRRPHGRARADPTPAPTAGGRQRRICDRRVGATDRVDGERAPGVAGARRLIRALARGALGVGSLMLRDGRRDLAHDERQHDAR